METEIAKPNQALHPGKFLTFFLGTEEYGIDILKVHEIVGLMPITTVPRSPKFVSGVINLRGKIIPVVDIRAKFGMDPKEHTKETCIIFIQSEMGHKIGAVVDKVSEVLEIPAAEIDDVPAFGTGVNTEYIVGIGKPNGKLKLLLDIEKVLSGINPRSDP